MHTWVINVYNIKEGNDKYKIQYCGCLLSQEKGLNEVQHIIKYHDFDDVIFKLSSGFIHDWWFHGFILLLYTHSHTHFCMQLYNANIF